MQITPRSRWQLSAHHGLFVVLLVALTTLVAWFAREYRVERDLTRAHRNTVSAATLEVLKAMDGPVTVTAYAIANDPRGENVHRRIEQFLRPYQRAKPDIALQLVDPREQPRAAAEAAVRGPLEMVVSYRERTERLTEFNEQTFANALMRLSRGAERQVLWLEGHGERRLDGAANHDLGEFGRQLRQKGFRVGALNLGVAQEVPANAALLVIATPQTDLLPAEVGRIRSHLAGGGNLLWLIDPEPLRGLQPLAEDLGLVLTPGTVIDPALAPRSGPPVYALGTTAGYGRHPVLDSLDLNTLFPNARQIGTIESDAWRVVPLVQVAQRGWVEVGKLEGEITFEKDRDFPGPVNIATAFERMVGDRQQRVVVVGNGAFLSNTFLGNGGNLDLGVNLVNWLSGDDRLITVQPRPAPDSNLDMPPMMLYLIAFTFLIALPLAFTVTGVLVWWRRR
ncbi:MAG: GldG family protein [Burkholderiales bacterium]|nr:GldG family protein [Burkholderiales bacterium]